MSGAKQFELTLRDILRITLEHCQAEPELLDTRLVSELVPIIVDCAQVAAGPTVFRHMLRAALGALRVPEERQ